MSKAQRKCRREDKASRNNKQATFTKIAKLKLKQQPKIETFFKYGATKVFYCPFCLGIHPFSKYLISTKKGYHKGLMQCPECNNKFRITTLTEIASPEEYAEFVYPYSASGFWQKVPWTKWKERLYGIGWAQRFWKRYKELKGEGQEDTYAQYLKDHQKEQAKEQDHIE